MAQMDIDHKGSIEADRTPRINSARMADNLGRTVRLVGKVLRISDTSAVLQATDHGQVNVRVPEGTLAANYVEIIGQVVDESTIRMLSYINLGNDLDMDLVNDCIEMTHDPRFAKIF